MTNVQFYFAIGVPMFSVLVVWLGSALVSTRALKALGQRIEDQGRRIEEQGKDLGRRIEEQGKDLGQRIEEQGRNLNQRLDDLRSEMRAGFEAINKRLDRLEARIDRIEDEVRKDHENRLARLEAKVFTSAA